MRITLKCSCLSRKFTLSLIYSAVAYEMSSCFSKHLTAVVPPDAVQFAIFYRHS